MSGFVSKWMVYRSLITDGMPLLFVGAIVGTLGTILSVYKLIHNMFLGQLRLEHDEVREAPLSMLVPMLGLATLIFLTGLHPRAGHRLGGRGAARWWACRWCSYTLGGVVDPRGGLDMIWLVSVLMAGFGVGALVFYGFGGKSRQVHQLDNYAGGHFLTAEVRYQYSDNFYAGLMHLIGPWYRGAFLWLEGSVAAVVDFLSYAMNWVYRSIQPLLFLLATAVAMLVWAAV